MIQQTHLPNINISLMQYCIMIHTYCIHILPYQYVLQIPSIIPTSYTYNTFSVVVCATPLKVLIQLNIEDCIVQVLVLIPTAVVGPYHVGEDAVDTGEPHIYQSFYNYICCTEVL